MNGIVASIGSPLELQDIYTAICHLDSGTATVLLNDAQHLPLLPYPSSLTHFSLSHLKTVIVVFNSYEEKIIGWYSLDGRKSLDGTHWMVAP
eukprot:424461-Hanusia_phi.AAC.1